MTRRDPLADAFRATVTRRRASARPLDREHRAALFAFAAVAVLAAVLILDRLATGAPL